MYTVMGALHITKYIYKSPVRFSMIDKKNNCFNKYIILVMKYVFIKPMFN